MCICINWLRIAICHILLAAIMISSDHENEPIDLLSDSDNDNDVDNENENVFDNSDLNSHNSGNNS